MFQVTPSERDGNYPVAARALKGALLLILLANFGSAYFIVQEYRDLSAALDAPAPLSGDAANALRLEAGIQLAASLVVFVILALCTAAIWWLRRRYLSSQKSLRQVKMLAHDILASMDNGVVTTNRAGVISSINSAAIKLLEVGFECVGQPLASIAPADVSLADLSREVIDSQTTVRDRDFILDRDGRTLRLRVDGHVLKDIEGTSLGCVLHLRDVTEPLILAERMRRMERFLGLATLASGLHHEIKNPLTALSIHIQLLEESLANGAAVPHAGCENVDELVGVLKTEVCRLNGVLESFRSFANLQKLTLRPTDALGVVENAIRLIRPQAAQQRVQITLLHPDEELPAVPLDADKFEQAVLNLIINALEAMPDGGRLTVSATMLDGAAFRVAVQDSGPGIPPEARANLFQPYFSTKTTGSGLGLALSEKLIGQHAGHIDYRTGPQGTTFEITLPLGSETVENGRAELLHPDRG